jgi:hypothetical protein
MGSGPSTEDQLSEAFTRIKALKAGGQRAPHKPLLLLLARGRIQRGEPQRGPMS